MNLKQTKYIYDINDCGKMKVYPKYRENLKSREERLDCLQRNDHPIDSAEDPIPIIRTHAEMTMF